MILAIMLTSSFQMLMMGVLGEYLWRNLDETRKRPLYVIDEVIEREDGETAGEKTEKPAPAGNEGS